MSDGTGSCVEYEQLLEELTSAVQLCVEYESPTVFPIDGQLLTPEQANLLRNEARAQKVRVEARVFIHQCTCLYCLHVP